MAYDEFFSDGDKPYSENLNDSLLLIDAFDVTVPVELPGMFSNGNFSSTVDVPRKANVAIVTLKSVDTGVTVGTDTISGTGDVVFRIYPNFNMFYKWQSIVLTKSGTVDITFKTTAGTTISATVGSDGTISEAGALKTLQPIDVVLSLTSATISNILIRFVNNQTVGRTRTRVLLDSIHLNNIDDALSGTSSNVVQNKVIKAAIDGKASSTHTHNKSDISDFGTYVEPSDLATVATTGSYNDLSDKPYIDGSYVHPSTKQCNYEYQHPSTKQCNYAYVHPTAKQCNAAIPEAYVHPSSKQCDYSYTHPSTKQCNAVIPAAYVHPSNKQCNYVYSHPASQQCSHDHSSWSSINVGSGTLYVNSAIRMCELQYFKSSFNITSANTFTFVETLSQLVSYPVTADYLLASTSTNGLVARVYPTGSVQVMSVVAGTFAIKFNMMWHY